MATATTAVEASVQDAIQRASAVTGVPASVLQWIHQNEVDIALQGPNQGTVTVNAGNGRRCGGFFGLCTNSGLNNGSDPYTQAVTTANNLLSYGKSTWQAAISAFNLGPNAPVGGYGAQYPGTGGPGGSSGNPGIGGQGFIQTGPGGTGVLAPPGTTFVQTGPGGQGIATGPAAHVNALSGGSGGGCEDWTIQLPSFFSGGSGSSFTLPGTRIFCVLSGFISTPQNWAIAGLLLLGAALAIGGLVLYAKGELL